MVTIVSQHPNTNHHCSQQPIIDHHCSQWTIIDHYWPTIGQSCLSHTYTSMFFLAIYTSNKSKSFHLELFPLCLFPESLPLLHLYEMRYTVIFSLFWSKNNQWICKSVGDIIWWCRATFWACINYFSLKRISETMLAMIYKSHMRK